MLTYVINTSENKVLKSDLLFELVGYHKIAWMRSSLSAIEDCAEEIVKRQQPMTAGEYRVVVLVDFLAFEKTLYPEENPVSEYLAIYKSLIEIYLNDHLYTPLRRAQLGFEGLEVFYIQYTEKNTIRDNAAEKEQLALLLGLDEEHDKIIAAKQASRTRSAARDEEKKAKSEENAAKEPDTYDVFYMEYRGGRLAFRADEFCKEIGKDERATFDRFYSNLSEKYNLAYRAFGSRSRTYVAGTASARSESRAAFDNLNLSLALIRAYEQEVDISSDRRDDVVDVPKMNKELFFDTLRHSYGKVQSALEQVRQSGNANGFYRLETKAAVSADICRTEMTDEERQETLAEGRGLSFHQKYERIKARASVPKGAKSPEEKAELARYMSEYKQTRDKKRKSASEEDVRALLSTAPKQNKYPSGLEYENAVEKKKATMRQILKFAIEADYVGADYSEEFAEANEALDRYTSAKARLKNYVRTNAICFLLVMLAMLVPYAVLQVGSSTLGAMLLISIALGVFGGVFVLSALLHVIPLWRDINAAKLQMNDVYGRCLIKRRESMLCLQRRYLVYLPAIEDIHNELEELSTLYEANREINRHIEEHREMLERVRDVLLGMLNSMQVAHKADGEVLLDDDEFKINESFRVNRIYKIFTIDVIEEIFGERRL